MTFVSIQTPLLQFGIRDFTCESCVFENINVGMSFIGESTTGQPQFFTAKDSEMLFEGEFSTSLSIISILNKTKRC